jgi:hypothetical protein
MKKYIINSFLVLALMTTACNDYNEDNFNGFDDLAKATDVKKMDYSLVAADYASIASNSTNKSLAKAAGDSAELANLKTTMVFTSTLEAANYIPAFLKATWFTADNGSAIKVSYNYNKGRSEYMPKYESLVKTLSATDYMSVNSTVGLAKSFTPSYTPADNLPAILLSSYPNAVSGDISLTYYNYTAQEPVVGQTTLFEETFDSGVSNFQTFSASGTKAWAASSYGQDFYMKISGYQEVNEDWLISPAIDLKGQVDVVLKLSQAAKYVNGQWNQITVNISTDYDGSNVATATWTPLTINTKPSGSDYVFVESEGVDLSNWKGQKIYIGFKYVSDLANAATWEINNVKVLAKGLTATGVSEQGAYYQFSGSKWSVLTNAYALSSADYLAMGINNKNFSSTINPDNYLALFLSQKYPYAQEKDSKIVGYKYYSSTTKTLSYKADEYTFIGGQWTKNSEIVTVTDQFVRANGNWVYNPSVVLNLTPGKGVALSTSYYQAATDWVWENVDQAMGITTKGQGYVTSYGNNEYYTGSSAYYNNIDLRPAAARTQYAAGYEGKTDAEVVVLMTEHLKATMAHVLAKLNPDAVPVDGVEVTYTLNVALYTGAASPTTTTHSLVYKVTGPATFEWVSGPTAIQ